LNREKALENSKRPRFMVPLLQLPPREMSIFVKPRIMRSSFLLFGLVLLAFQAFSQAQIRRLPSSINHPSLNLFAPFISADGNALIYISDNGQDGAYLVNYTSRDKDWAPPVELPKQLNNRLNFMRGYALSADGKRIYVTSAKSPIIGGYDIFTAELKGTAWTNPENLMLPINSTENEGCPSISADGNTIYFMRCPKMDAMKAEGCRIFRSSKKPNGQWEEPTELPATINTGNSQTPRIMADGETLIFASDKMQGGKGGMDLYMSRFRSGNWSAPVPLDFVNTDKDDQYISATALGRYLLKESKGARNNSELTEFLIPQQLRPKGLMKVEGTVAITGGSPNQAFLTVVDQASKKRIYNAKPNADGTFAFYIPEGSVYDVSVDAEQSEFTYFSKTFDLTTDKIPQKEKLAVTLKKPASGDVFVLDPVQFAEPAPVFRGGAEDELKRLARLIKSNPSKTFELQVELSGYKEDSLQGDPDLTEVRVDTITVEEPLTDSLQVTEPAVRNTYHNDRTIKQAEALLSYLMRQGVRREQLMYTVSALPATTGEKKTTIRAVVK
jgi:hypothetical protein